MPRKKIKKTNRSDISELRIKEAIKAILTNRLSQYKAAVEYQVKRQTMQSRIKKLLQRKSKDELLREWEDSGNESDSLQPNNSFSNKYTSQQIFDYKQEKELVAYIKTCSDLNYGLNYHQIKVLAYKYAKVLKITPAKWEQRGIAGRDWLKCFVKRHKQEISLRKPENTSLSRSMAFNKPVVDNFFTRYSETIQKYNFKADQIYNLDKTGITTVMPPVKIVTPRGKKQVAHIASQERGELVMFVGIISAMGVVVPPVFVYPRIRNPEQYLGDDCPVSSVAMGSKTGWMTSEIFPKVIQHFIQYVKCSFENKVLLLLDNHDSHISVETLNLCRENGIVLLSFPPHTTHRLQPLDIGIYSPFKSYLKTAHHDWLLTNPGKVITIRHLARLAKLAFEQAFTIKNIVSSFKNTGLWHLNRLIFSDSEFAPSEVTERELLPQNEENDTHSSQLAEQSMPSTSAASLAANDANSSQLAEKSMPSTSAASLAATEQQVQPSLTDIRPYPKSTEKGPRKKNSKRVTKSRVYTDTPELEKRQNIEEERKRKESLKKNKTVKRKLSVAASKTNNKKRTLSTSSNSSVDIYLNDSSDDEQFLENLREISQEDNLTVGTFVLVKFILSRSPAVYYAGKITTLPDINNEEFEISFLRRKRKTFSFIFPDVEDISMVEKKDIVAILPFASLQGTSRVANVYRFNVKFADLNVR